MTHVSRNGHGPFLILNLILGCFTNHFSGRFFWFNREFFPVEPWCPSLFVLFYQYLIRPLIFIYRMLTIKNHDWKIYKTNVNKQCYSVCKHFLQFLIFQSWCLIVSMRYNDLDNKLQYSIKIYSLVIFLLISITIKLMALIISKFLIMWKNVTIECHISKKLKNVTILCHIPRPTFR